MTGGTRNRDTERRTVQLMRAAIFAWYGSACACCGSTEDLGVDHVDGDGKAHREALFGLNSVSGRFYRHLIDNGFPDDPPLQVHCRSCNTSKGTGEQCRLDHADREGQRRRNARAAQAAWRTRHNTHRSVSIREDTHGGRILAYLGEHGVSWSGDIIKGTGASAVTLGGLLREGHIIQPGRRLYCLPGQEPDWVRPGITGGYSVNSADASCCCPCARSHPGKPVCWETNAMQVRRVQTLDLGLVCIRVCRPCREAGGCYA